ncbi:hypothetical protein IMZ11_21195 [Microtetraspora sp. AC03309]|uniref:hypothetical protein n=1 Tax=Microtetraspora sp. AC03309 TaxID=2779376 RepID=UPI001E3027E7|nr:hypothetical protein [Microtetraspora sp. AC03309]MCC5578147.1 hypothetical protein [Microtetraspora sp. AC03309]
MTRYLAGLITATAALGAGVWLLIAPYGLNYPSGSTASEVDAWTGALVCVFSLATIGVWSRAWRAQLRADGLLPERQAVRPDRSALPHPDEHGRADSSDAARVARALEEEPPPPPPQVPTIEDLHGLLKPLVAALAADQMERIHAPSAQPQNAQPQNAHQQNAHQQNARPRNAHGPSTHTQTAYTNAEEDW